MLRRIYKRLRKALLRMELHRYLPHDRSHHIPEGTVFFTDREAHVFFGYYDIDPMSPDGSKLLACRVRKSGGTEGEQMEVGYFNFVTPDAPFVPVGTTTAWNWQQGCRARWGRNRFEGTILYNGVIDGAVCALRHQLATGITTTLSARPLYAVDAACEWGLSLDFGRLYRFRPGYGYVDTAPHHFEDDQAPQADGVWLVDLSSGKSKLVISYRDLADFEGEKGTDIHHYVNHLDFLPGDGRIQLFHVLSRNGGKGTVRLVTAERDGTGLRRIETEIRPSHYCWLDDHHVLITGLAPDRRCRFAIFDERTGRETASLDDVFTEDGHPSCIPAAGWIADTYPDRTGRQYLYFARAADRKRKTLASFHSPAAFKGDARCDLHPRHSPERSCILVDCVVEDRRAMAVIPFAPEGPLRSPT
jgi:hypothetical protein